MGAHKPFKVKLQVKFTFGLVLLALILAVSLSMAIAKYYRTTMESYYVKIAFDQAKIAADFIDGDTVKDYADSLKTDEYYDEVQRFLLQAKKTIGLEYYYVVIPRESDMFYIWDAGDPGEDGVCQLGDADAYYGGGNELMKDAFSNPDGRDSILITNNETYGYLASAYVPILNSSGKPVALASVDVSMDKINDDIRAFMLIVITLVVVILLGFIIAYYFFIQAAVIVPVKKLHTATSNMVNNQMSDIENFFIDIRTGDEIEDLSKAFTYMTMELKDYIKNLSQVTAEKERIGAELDVAKHIQASMLPCIFPAFPDRPELDIYATMTPAKEVGGDFYDFFLVDEDHLVMVMADVSGKGVPAALFMVIAKTLLKNCAQTGLSPKQVLEKVNDQLCESNEAELFVTVWMGNLEISTGKLIAANAGHEYPVVKKAQGDYELIKDKHGFVLAGMEGARYKEYELLLAPGDTLYLYTDGVAEATDAHNVLFGTDRMLESLNRCKGFSPQQLLYGVKADIDAFVGEAPQFDDITMLGINFKGGNAS